MGISNLENIKLSQLRALLTIAETGNFSEAALQLSVSQSAVSHAIAALEEELGVVVLSRGRHGARLTPVGERITSHAREMLRLLESIGKEADLSKGLEGGQVRVAAFRSVATHVLPEIIARFRRCYPAIAVNIIEYRGDEGVEHALRDGRADIGFTCMPTNDEFESWEFLRDEYFVLFPPAPKRDVDTTTWEELATFPIIMPPSNDYCSILIRGHLLRVGCHLTATYEIQEDSTIVSMVSQGLGITIMARLAAEPLPEDIQIARLPLPLERIVRVATLANALHPPAVFAFMDVLREYRSTHSKFAAGDGSAAQKATSLK